MARDLRLAPRTITSSVDLLARDGLVLRGPDPQQRSAHRISITPAGTAVLAEAQRISAEIGRDVDTVLTTSERDLLQNLMRRVSDRLLGRSA